ncbi:hypothetical protein HYALB_00004264 [Hymenoscyphus albidus]|uniref:Uncharacterized protein n=1 Tax=Hymenoscyphus albidus TaxID=595503 RepID=A0A9N9LJJ2_9HELO|nr:hypothetical protein HYALB_00004264 [Hymenoscyphus albidus]
MASDPDRHNDSRLNHDPSQSNPNPFIKFRQFADAQVGSFLQGLIGLPSAFSKNSANARWADFDDDLRRRDDLQTRLRQLKDADAQHNHHEEEVEGNIPVKKWQGRHSWVHSRQPNGAPESVEADLPLYSPVEKSLFAHLPYLGDREPVFKYSNLIIGIPGKAYTPENGPLNLTREQVSSDAMNRIRYSVYNQLTVNPTLQSGYSLLPYLLFSPYSPIKLDIDAEDIPTHQKPDTFPYSQAFEDLIKTTHGSPWHYLSPTFRSLRGAEHTIAGESFIRDLYLGGFLQQKETKTIAYRIPRSFPTSPPSVQKTVSYADVQDTETEQDMYNWFLQTVASPESIAGAVEALFETIFSDGELSKLMNHMKEMRDITTPEGRQSLRDSLSSSSNKDIRDLMKELERVGFLPPAPKESDSTPEERQADDLPEQAVVTRPTPVQDPNKVISSSTKTEQHTNEDGTVDTTVTVWKKYADGRDTCTTTRHIESRPTDSEQENGSERVDEKVNEKKKGWFWN